MVRAPYTRDAPHWQQLGVQPVPPPHTHPRRGDQLDSEAPQPVFQAAINRHQNLAGMRPAMTFHCGKEPEKKILYVLF